MARLRELLAHYRRLWRGAVLFAMVLCWGCSGSSLTPAEAAATSGPALACIAHELKVARDNEEAGGDCKGAVAAISVVLATDPDCIASKTTDGNYTCKPKKDGGHDAERE